MKYDNITEAVFVSRPNRFIAQVEKDGEEITVHVKNTGRCRELLVPGRKVYLSGSDVPGRKTRYDLIAAVRDGKMFNLDSMAPNKVMEEHLKSCSPALRVKREVTYSDSRFDLQTVGEDGEVTFIEVKGVTLENGGHARFPDAPTERGVKHINSLIRAAGEGYRAMIAFVIRTGDVTDLSPNWETHPAFGEALARAAERGVEIRAWSCLVTPDSIVLDRPVPVVLDRPGVI